MTPNLNNLLVQRQMTERYREADNERLARKLSRTGATRPPSRPGFRGRVRRGFGRLVPSI